MRHNKTTHSAKVAGKNGFTLISDDTFREMYAALLKCSLLDEQLRAHAGHSSWTGCRSATAGTICCLRAGDSVVPTPRGTMARFLHLGRLDLRAGDPDSGPASHLATATGDALRHKLEKRGNVSVVFTGIAEPEVMRAVFTAAAQQSLPVLYIFEGGAPVADACADIPVIRVDAADTVAFYRVAFESIARARSLGGPTIVECAPWPGDEGADPLARLENYLVAKRLFRRDWQLQLEKKFAPAVAKAAVEFSGK